MMGWRFTVREAVGLRCCWHYSVPGFRLFVFRTVHRKNGGLFVWDCR